MTNNIGISWSIMILCLVIKVQIPLGSERIDYTTGLGSLARTLHCLCIALEGQLELKEVLITFTN